MYARIIATALVGIGSALLTPETLAGGPNEGCHTIAQGIMRCDATSERSREAVRAELRNVQAVGELKVVGELSDAPVGPIVVPSSGAVLTRAEVRNQVAIARARHELPRNGDVF